MSDTELERTETTKGKRIIFGFPRLGTSLVLGIEGFALFTLYYLGYGLDSVSVGFALAMGYLSIAAGQFLLGWISDAKYTKLGRRKPYLVIFGPLLGISFIFLLLPALVLPDMTDKNILFIWLLIWDVIFRFSYAVTTPYQAWMAELFPTSERPKVSQTQNTFNFIGNGLMALTTLLVLTGVFEKVAANPNVIPPEFLLIVVVFGIISSILFILIVFIMPTEPNHTIESSLWESLKTTVKNNNFMKIVLMQGISGFGWSIISTVMLTYTEDVLALGTTEYIIVAVIFLLSIFVFLYLWRKQIERIGKKKTLLYIFLIAVVFLPITLLGLVGAIPNLILGIFFITGIGLILGGWYLFPYIMYADIAEDDEKSTGELKAGVYVGFPSIVLNIFQAIGVFLLGLMLGLPDVTVGTSTFSIGLVIWGPICSLILLVSYFYTRKFVELDFEWEK
jgi:GPH family glycoside/pentoside/hexuronide:cation symporter